MRTDGRRSRSVQGFCFMSELGGRGHHHHTILSSDCCTPMEPEDNYVQLFLDFHIHTSSRDQTHVCAASTLIIFLAPVDFLKKYTSSGGISLSLFLLISQSNLGEVLGSPYQL